MSTDLVLRLRAYDSKNHRGKYAVICREAAAELERLREALKLIAEETTCPELFPEEKDENMLQLHTAVVIARCALDPEAGSHGH